MQQCEAGIMPRILSQPGRFHMLAISKCIALLATGLLLATAADCRAGDAASTVPTASVRDGKLQGRHAEGLSVFQGIPFAAPPTGALRWREPQPVQPWNGVRKADAYAASCMQKTGMPVSAGGTTGPLSEDCLYLNVWTPSTGPAGKRPVMVWIHGGALVYGSGNVPLYDGTALARRGAVVVTINYRMGALGFFTHPALDGGRAAAPANYGLLDQIAALRWVRDNIAAFGGDPGNVTIFGESAGAQSVLALYASPLAKGLFHRGIAQSPYGIPSHTRKHARDISVKVSTAVGAAGADATASQLRAIPAERFFDLGDKGPTLAPGFIVGDAAVPRPILQAFQNKHQARVPLIIGSNSDEATVALAFGVDSAALIARMGGGRALVKKLYPDVTDDAQLGRELVRDVVFTAFARRISYLHSQSAPTWRYYFSHVQENMQGKVPGVAHGAEIPFVMGTGDRCDCLPAAFTDLDRMVSGDVGDYWASFARSGTPAVAGAPRWPQDGRKNVHVMEFATRPMPREDFMSTRLDALILTLKAAGSAWGKQ